MNNKFIIKDNTQLKEPKLIGSILTSKNIPASENAIYDMHMHSTCSNEEDYKMPTPEEYIERAYKVAKKNNCKVKLSITDHQSIEGSKRAIKYLK